MEIAARSAVESENSIEVRVQKVEQLFHTLDPYPFKERGLASEAEDYIVSFARECSPSQRLRIVLHLPPEAAASAEAQGLPEAILNHFRERAESVGRELRELFRLGRTAALIGVGVLIGVSIIVELLLVPAFENTQRWIVESFFILAWVANWKPLEIFLYDWWPIERRRRLYRRLAAAEVSLQPS